MSKARDLADFISSPTVEATEIANGAITEDKIANTAVTADKLHTTLNLSSKTLTFANNHLSGDNIHGGIISDFQSTGIDDNATSTAVTISTDGNATFANNVTATSFTGDGSNLTGLPPGYTNSDVAAYLSANDYDTATNIIAEISNSAPTTLNTLNELAAALGDDANFSTTVTDALGNRLRIDTAAQSLTSTQKTNALTNLGITATVAELNYVDGVTSNIQTQLNAKATSTDLTDGTITKINNQATVGDSIEFFQNDGGGNLGIRFNANYNSGDFSVEDGSAWEFQFNNDSTSGDFLIYYDGSINAASESITWTEALRLDGGNSSLYVWGDKVAYFEGQDLTIDKASAKVIFKDTASGGPHGLDFYDTDGTLRWGNYYRTTPETLTWEVGGSTTVLTLDTSGNLILSGNSADLNLRTGTTGQTAFINWQFNSTSTNYIQMGIDYDTRASTGWFIDSGYPITIDYTTSLQFKASGTNTISIDSGGNLSNVGIMTAVRARLTGTGDVSLSSTNHAFQIGPDSGVNIAIDGNEIQARNNGATSTLHLNLEGGSTTVGGALNVTGGITSDGVLRGTTTTGAGTPTFSFDGDTNTGMYHVSADVIGFTTGGTERARISSSGLQLADGKLVTFDNTSDANYDITIGSYYDYDAWCQFKDGGGVTRFSIGRDNNAYLGGAGTAGNRVLTQADEGSGNGLDADTVDGIHGSSFLRSDASDTTTGSLTVNGDVIVDEIRARSSQDLCITAGEARNHLTDSTYNDEVIRIAAESGVVAYSSSDNLTSGLNYSMTIINNQGHTITGGTLNATAGLIVGRTSTTTDFHNANDAGAMSVRGSTTHPALISFHRAGAYAFQFGLDTDNHLKMGGWSIGNNTPHTWQNNGNYLATGNITAYSSDKRLKINVVNIPKALNKVMSLNGVTFDWKEKVQDLGFEPTRMHNEVGVLAQEVEAVLPQATAPAPFDLKNDNGQTISKSGENYLTVQYEKIVPLLIEAIKEQQAQIEELKKKIQE